MQIETPGERVRAMRFGRFSREDNALALAMRSGAVVVKMLQRSANVGDEAGGAAVGGPPPEQDVPLPLPQKTQLYVDQTEREKEQVSESPKASELEPEPSRAERTNRRGEAGRRDGGFNIYGHFLSLSSFFLSVSFFLSFFLSSFFLS